MYIDWVEALREQPRERATPADLWEVDWNVLEFLAASQTRLTQTPLLAAMEKSGLTVDESSIKKSLARLRKWGLIDNTKEIRSRGYGILADGLEFLDLRRESAGS